MNFWGFLKRLIMRRGDSSNVEDTDSDSAEEDVTESEESTAHKKLQLLGIPLYKLSYKQLPKKCIKFSFLALNGATFLAGITATIISIWMLADSKLMSRLVGQKLFVTILLFIGIFASLVSFIGIMAFVKRRRKFLIIVTLLFSFVFTGMMQTRVYIICQSITLSLVFVCAIMSFSFFEQVTKKVRDDMVSTIINYRNLDWVTEAWDNTHKYLKCCGIKSFADWYEYRMTIPHSCCSSSVEQCLSMTEGVAYKSGCLKGAVLLLKSHIHTVALSALFISIALIASLFFTLGVKQRFRTSRSNGA